MVNPNELLNISDEIEPELVKLDSSSESDEETSQENINFDEAPLEIEEEVNNKDARSVHVSTPYASPSHSPINVPKINTPPSPENNIEQVDLNQLDFNFSESLRREKLKVTLNSLEKNGSKSDDSNSSDNSSDDNCNSNSSGSSSDGDDDDSIGDDDLPIIHISNLKSSRTNSVSGRNSSCDVSVKTTEKKNVVGTQNNKLAGNSPKNNLININNSPPDSPTPPFSNNNNTNNNQSKNPNEYFPCNNSINEPISECPIQKFLQDANSHSPVLRQQCCRSMHKALEAIIINLQQVALDPIIKKNKRQFLSFCHIIRHLAGDTEPMVRAEALNKLANIFPPLKFEILFAQERTAAGLLDFEEDIFNLIIPNIISATPHQNSQIRKSAHSTLEKLMLYDKLPEPIITTDFIENHIVPEILKNVTVEKSGDEVKTDNITFLIKLISSKRYGCFTVQNQNIKSKIIALWLENSASFQNLENRINYMSALGQNLGQNLQTANLKATATENPSTHLSTSNFPTICASNTFHVRQMCANLTPHIVAQLPSHQIEEIIFPRIDQLATDNVWGVRRAVADILPEVVSHCCKRLRFEKFIDIYLGLLNDKSRWVRMTSYTKLSSFIYSLTQDDKDEYRGSLSGRLNRLESGNSQSSDFEVSRTVLNLSNKENLLTEQKKQTDSEINTQKRKRRISSDDGTEKTVVAIDASDCLLTEEQEYKKQQNQQFISSTSPSFSELKQNFSNNSEKDDDFINNNDTENHLPQEEEKNNKVSEKESEPDNSLVTKMTIQGEIIQTDEPPKSQNQTQPKTENSPSTTPKIDSNNSTPTKSTSIPSGETTKTSSSGEENSKIFDSQNSIINNNNFIKAEPIYEIPETLIKHYCLMIDPIKKQQVDGDLAYKCALGIPDIARSKCAQKYWYSHVQALFQNLLGFGG